MSTPPPPSSLTHTHTINHLNIVFFIYEDTRTFLYSCKVDMATLSCVEYAPVSVISFIDPHVGKTIIVFCLFTFMFFCWGWGWGKGDYVPNIFETLCLYFHFL